MLRYNDWFNWQLVGFPLYYHIAQLVALVSLTKQEELEQTSVFKIIRDLYLLT